MRSIDIKGLAVFEIASGREIGKVSELLINAQEKSVQYLVIDVPNWYFGSYVIPFNLTEGIGEDAVIIESESLIRKLNEDPEAVNLVDSGVTLIGSKVLTKKGKHIGRVSEIYIDENNGQVTGCELADNITVKGIIPVKYALTFGRDALIVDEKTEDNLLNTMEELEQELALEVPDDLPPFTEEEASGSEAEPELDAPATDDQADDKPKAVKLYEQKQREYLLGRTVKEDIYDNSGNLIIKSGEKITKEILDKAAASVTLKELLLHV
ncbi:MAG: hypothetical protein GX052_07080 [Syntrophomonadaceae bacterium]|nr:hypothetical protein [Syntrophomonadaceae bacterium]